MNAPKTRSEEAQRAASGHVPKPLDAGETRLVLFTAGAIALFLYLIRTILLPFVLAAVVAYICTPPLDWLAKRTRLPRLLMAVLLFLILLGIAAFTLTVAAQHLAAETTSTARRPAEHAR